MRRTAGWLALCLLVAMASPALAGEPKAAGAPKAAGTLTVTYYYIPG